jgi:hypothetical protein
MDREMFRKFLLKHIETRPRMRVQDVYKLLFQGVFGVGHIMGEDAYGRLLEEAGRINLQDHPWELLLEPASVDGETVRVNLRPYLRRGGSLDDLYEAMKESSTVKGDPEDFMSLWGLFKELAEEGQLGLDSETVVRYDEELKATGPKPRHHSAEYREAYYPAYRIVRRRLFEKHVSSGIFQ